MLRNDCLLAKSVPIQTNTSHILLNLGNFCHHSANDRASHALAAPQTTTIAYVLYLISK